MILKKQKHDVIFKNLVKLTVAFALLVGIAYSQNSFAQTNRQNNSQIRVAQDFERRGDYVTALKIYRSLFNLVPNNQLYYEGVKRNMLRLKMFEELSQIVMSRIRQTNAPRFQADLGNVYYKQGAHEQAMVIWNSLLDKYPQNSTVYPYVANAMMDNRLYDEAIVVYQRARKNLQKEDIFVFELANIYVIRLNYKAATLEYLKYLGKNPQQFNYIEGRIASYTKEPEQAQVVADVLKANLAHTKQEYLVRKQLADLYLRIEDYGNSLDEFKILEDMTDPLAGKNKATGKEIYFFAEKALNAGEYLYAQQAFDLILSKYNNSPFKIRAIYGSAFAERQQGLTSEAIESYQMLIASAPRSPWAEEALFQIGEIYFEDLFEVDQALEAYLSLLKKYPRGRKILDTYFRIGDSYAAKGELKTARTWYERPLHRNDTNALIRDKALYKSAYIDFMNAEFDSALEKLNKITQTMQRKGNIDQSFVNDALELIILIEENKQASFDALKKYGLAQKLRLQRKNSEAIKQLQQILANFPAASIIDESLLNLGELETGRKNYVAAIDYFQNLLQTHPESVYNALAQKRIGELYESGLGEYQKAYQAYEQV
ncbi:MAG: tetratricopeptide repeat protein, partial [bacterium]